jgi:16S rRNA (guanine527-N7)-methyltransferase
MTGAIASLTTPGIDVATGLRSLGLSLSDAVCAKLDAYVVLLAKWNRTYNLTAIREPARMMTHHVLDALSVLPHLPQRAELRLLDVGAGGGVPGIPLAIARPGWQVVLVDSNGKKSTFLTQAVIELGLLNVRAVATRVEDLHDEPQFDVVIARAFSDLSTFAQSSACHLTPAGALYAMKGAYPAEELAALPPSIEVVAAPKLRVPGLDAERHLIVMRPGAMPA